MRVYNEAVKSLEGIEKSKQFEKVEYCFEILNSFLEALKYYLAQNKEEFCFSLAGMQNKVFWVGQFLK